MEDSIDNIEKELEVSEKKYKDILEEINKQFRKELRLIGVRKNVIPIKYILPKYMIIRLLEDRNFRRVWEQKIIWRNINGEWIVMRTYPNIGGIPVEEGTELKVVVQKIPRRERGKKS